MEEHDRLVAARAQRINQVMEQVFDKTDARLCSDHKDLVELSGSTGSVLLVQEDYFVVANVGDSPVVLFREEQGEIKGE